jgi:hypothetical protein
MYYIIHIATAFQSFKAQPREIQELIWARMLNDLRKKDPTHPILSATLDQYLAKEAVDSAALSCLLKKKMALTPEFGHIIGIGKALVMNGSAPKLTVAIARTIDDEKGLLQTFWQRLRAFTKDRGIPTFVTWNGLGFTFPFLIERSTALGVEPSCILPASCLDPAFNPGNISIFSPSWPPMIRTGI